MKKKPTTKGIINLYKWTKSAAIIYLNGRIYQTKVKWNHKDK